MPHEIEQCRRAHAALRRVRNAIIHHQIHAFAWISTRRTGMPIMFCVFDRKSPGAVKPYILLLDDVDARRGTAGLVLSGQLSVVDVAVVAH